MSKAEQRALEAYPPKYVKQERHLKRMQSERIDTHRPIRAIYIKGYQQAEKDLALTWEDIKYIVQTFHRIICDTKNITSDEGCVKTLQIFNEQRENNDTQRNP